MCIRDRYMGNAVNHFESIGGKPFSFEFEFLGEEGVGPGPSREYFTVICHALRLPVHNMWRKTSDGSLFPSPIDPLDLREFKHSSNRRRPKADDERDFEKLHLLFRLTGTMVAIALLDERTLDLPLSPIFWRLVLDLPVTVADIALVDRELGEVILELSAISHHKRQGAPPEQLLFKGVPIEDLGLTFTFPGYDEIDIVPNGISKAVTLANVDEYVSALAHYWLVETVKTQVHYFREGFRKVLPLEYLAHFLPTEIGLLFAEPDEDPHWSLEELQRSILPAYGYNEESRTFKNLLKLMSKFDLEQRRSFLLFVTGSSRLPPGGFSGLHPHLSVVKKLPNPAPKGARQQTADEMLPSVMTCQNYLKLPDYSSYEILSQKILYVLAECPSGFQFS
eukprot:TRINITY_DN19876_c0_g1_i2.p1 TRINITY_DN19876_c0_g1~~TRINITY_DN19876_c0_g1_i2.p1  ORF type:complete len:393 (+),score=87.06 TRINITY_DN19876_c0_g1_i2:64-1242(+)